MTLVAVVKIGHILVYVLLIVGRTQIVGIEENDIDNPLYTESELCPH